MFTEKELKKLASLSKLKIDPKEIEKFQKEISQILSYVQKLKEVETQDKEMLYFSWLKERKREDLPKDLFPKKDLKTYFLEQKNDFLKTKKIL
ncbi:Asp-tRNA(Asn)/Glu-tRNA(Gln) amidotransferase subunit GatC [Candidatus Parcubacteria bacterium]|nr:Asp-tRNA(Asn)/Glu-tRNA(Gln) amidotransferase subunit GatC [Candidatus Parcubacteria bacterium]